MSFVVLPYGSDEKEAWNSFVARSKNGTFLLDRRYMDYHIDRFTDASRLVMADGLLVAVLPANVRDDVVSSHAGLTYGGLVVDERMTTEQMLGVVDAVAASLAAGGARRLVYKTIPYIYHRLPAEEDRYALFRHDAQLVRRDVLAVLAPGAKPKYQERRRRGVKKAVAQGVTVQESADLRTFWTILESTLSERHAARPVHSVEEMLLLASRFTQNIRLFSAFAGSEMIAGVVVFETDRVAHVQYIAASEAGRERGALDLVFDTLIQNTFAHKPYFDFGISNEDQGRTLNVGLIAQKEGFGARAVVHDVYEMAL